MNWAMPSAPAGETADGFQPDSTSIWAASRGAEIPAHREAASSSTGIRVGIGTAVVARTGAADTSLAPLAATATRPTTPKTRAHSAMPITVSVLVGTIRPFAFSTHEELGRQTTLGRRNLESFGNVSKTASYGPVLPVSPQRDHMNIGRATVTPINAVSQACRPMADYLFREALGVAPSKDVLRAAKNALMPLRGHPGWIGWAVIVLLEGSES